MVEKGLWGSNVEHTKSLPRETPSGAAWMEDTLGFVAAECSVAWRGRGWSQQEWSGGPPAVQMGEKEVLKAVAIEMEIKGDSGT